VPTQDKQPVPLPPPPKLQQVIKPNLAMSKEEESTQISTALLADDSFPPELPVKETIGKSTPLMCPRTYALDHPAIPLLMTYAREGCPVDCGPDWSKTQIEAMLMRGPHVSAKEPQAIDQAIAETQEKIKNNYARIVTYGDIKENLPKNLKISPMAMIPHKSKAFRCILDLSFQLKLNNKLCESVNSTTNKKAKAEAMVQLGQSLKRIVACIADNATANHPFYFSKLDIKDGF
jgi:hypothetical protein